VSNGMQAECSVIVLPTSVTVSYTYYYPYYMRRTVSLTISVADYEYYKSIIRYPIYSDSQYADYANDPSDDDYIRSVAEILRGKAVEYSLSESQTVDMVICFVQYLTYMDDYATTGYLEYPKYPIETLYDKGGDCEDTSILLTSLLSELGYNTVLIAFEDHMAAGIADNGTYSGAYYEYNGVKYFYIETTGTGWEIGELPYEYYEQEATLCKVN